MTVFALKNNHPQKKKNNESDIFDNVNDTGFYEIL